MKYCFHDAEYNEKMKQNSKQLQQYNCLKTELFSRVRK